MGDERDDREDRDHRDGDEPASSVTRCVDLSADVDTVWEAVADPERRGLWLDDDDALGRLVHVEQVDEGRSLSWTWWHPGDVATASRVDVWLTELDGGGTRVLVHERLLPTASGIAGAEARAQVGAGLARTGVAAGRIWDGRLLGLELLLVAAGALVA
jgi:uncharacterized protein YndB with AHSA1/START domain